MLIWLVWTRKTGLWKLLWVSLSIIGYSYIANFGEINENDFKKNIQILNDRRRTSVPYFSSKNRTVLVYTIFRLFFALISLENDALKFVMFVIPSISFSKYRINSFQNKALKCRKIYKSKLQNYNEISIQTSNRLIFRKCPLTTSIVLQKAIFDIPLLWDAAVPKLDIPIENNFTRPVSVFNVAYFSQVSKCGFCLE